MQKRSHRSNNSSHYSTNIFCGSVVPFTKMRFINMIFFTIFIIIIIVFLITEATAENDPKRERLQERKAEEKEKREYQEWYNKLQSSKLFEEITTKLFSKGFPYELHFGHRNANYIYNGDWIEYKQRTYPPLENDNALKAFVDLILEKYPGKYRI